MNLLLRLLIIVLVAVAILFGVGFFLPGAVDLERRTEISAPPEDVYPYVADLHRWQAWSPWAARDPERLVSYEGPESGAGATMRWRSEHAILGDGSLETTAVEQNRLVRHRLAFGDQWTADAVIKLEPSDTGCVAAWGLEGQLEENPIARFRGLVYRFVLGADLARGLAQLKTLVEEGEAAQQ